MDKKYWNAVAQNYDDEIFDVFANDQDNLISKNIKKYTTSNCIINDFGCGIGKILPILSQRGQEVNAIDLSEECLKTAKENTKNIENIHFFRKDLCSKDLSLPEADFGICVNAVMMPGIDKRNYFLSNVSHSIKRGGHLLLVVPSLESFHYVNMRFHEWNLMDGVLVKDSVKGLVETLSGNVMDILKGMISIDGVPTKHYLKEELDVLLKGNYLEIKTLEKIEYSWDTEFVNPPKWLKDPYPWDWFVLAQKV